jgi:hypothetical protein
MRFRDDDFTRVPAQTGQNRANERCWLVCGAYATTDENERRLKRKATHARNIRRGLKDGRNE